jgi:hypothetical protein
MNNRTMITSFAYNVGMWKNFAMMKLKKDKRWSRKTKAFKLSNTHFTYMLIASKNLARGEKISLIAPWRVP